MPRNEYEFRDLEGIGPVTWERYGPKLLLALTLKDPAVTLALRDSKPWKDLSRWRNRVAKSRASPASAILTTGQLDFLVGAMPRTDKQYAALVAANGMPEEYGPDITRIFRKYRVGAGAA
jgi:hypothetical protein